MTGNEQMRRLIDHYGYASVIELLIDAGEEEKEELQRQGLGGMATVYEATTDALAQALSCIMGADA